MFNTPTPTQERLSPIEIDISQMKILLAETSARIHRLYSAPMVSEYAFFVDYMLN
jgi:hypothetical protein